MKIGSFDTDDAVFVIAEIGNNHEGDFTLAQDMVGMAAEAGADAVKFQTFDPALFVSGADADRLERLRKFQLSHEQFSALARQATDLGLTFFSTPLDIQSAHFLNGIQPLFKIASGDNTFYPLIDTVAGFGKPTIISTGLADLELLTSLCERWQAYQGAGELALLHCVASYPVPFDQANIGAIAALKKTFPQATIGYSDHTFGVEAAVLAVAAGARIVEKHFTADKNHSDFRDHQLSADPPEMRALVEAIRRAEVIMGNGDKVAQACEADLMTAARRSIAAGRSIDKGQVLAHEDLIWVRPGSGLPPGQEDRVIGRKAARSLAPGDIIAEDDLV